MTSPDETDTDSELLESALSEFVLAHGADRSSQFCEETLRGWLTRLPRHLHDDFIECVAVAGGLQETQDLAPGDKVRLRRMLRAPIATPCAEVDPSRVGRYEIQYVIARRGGSTVYLAFDSELQRFVAVKILPQSEDERAIRRFEREARILAALNHPDIVRIYDSGREGGRPFLVLEYIEGGDLSGFHTPTTDEDRRQEVEHASRLAGALAWLHAQGICHRDIKPSNVLLRPDGRAALADFGLARALDEESSLTGKLLGTPAYMAPEQVRDPITAGSPADVYALACLVAERLSGLPPHLDRPFTRILRDLDEGRPPLGAEHFARISKSLVPTLEACLRPDPKARPDSADLQKDFDAWLAGRPPVLGDRTVVARSLHSIYSRRRFLGGLCLAGVGMGGLGLAAHALLTGNGPLSATEDPVTSFDRIGSLLFDTGDFASQLEPVYQMEEGYSLLASRFLEPAKGDWETKRLKQCESLRSQGDFTPGHARLLDVCIAFRRGESDRLPALLARPFPGRMGLDIEYLRRDPAKGSSVALARTSEVFEDFAFEEADPLDAFFLALALMALWEETLGPFSQYRKLPAEEEIPQVDVMRSLIAKARSQRGSWLGWTELLATGLGRIACPGLEGDSSPLLARNHLPDSFWANYLAAGVVIDRSSDASAYVDTWSDMHQRFPESRMVQTLLEYWSYPLHPPSWQRSLDTLFYKDREPALALRWIDYAFANSHFDPSRPDSVDSLVRSWLSDHPKSKDLILYAAVQYLILEQPLPASIRALMVEYGYKIPQDDSVLTGIIRRQRRLTVQDIPGDGPLREMEKQLGLLQAIELYTASDGSGAKQIWAAMRCSLTGLLATRQAALPTWVYRSALTAMEQTHVNGANYHAIVSWHRLLCPILETQGRAENALSRALRGLAALGPIPLLHRSMQFKLLKLLKLGELWSKDQAALARTRLAEALDLARNLPSAHCAERESLAGVAFTLAHLSSQLSDAKAFAESKTLWRSAVSSFGLPEAHENLEEIFR